MFQSKPQRIFGVPVAQHVDKAIKSYTKHLKRQWSQPWAKGTVVEGGGKYVPAIARFAAGDKLGGIEEAGRIFFKQQKKYATPSPWVHHHRRSYTKYKRPYKRRRGLQYKHGKRYRSAYRKPYRPRRYGYKIYKKNKLQRKYKTKRKIKSYY